MKVSEILDIIIIIIIIIVGEQKLVPEEPHGLQSKSLDTQSIYS